MTCPLTTEAGDEKAIQRVTLPIMHNIKALKEGDELLLYVEPSVPTTIMPAQTLGHVARKRPAAAESVEPRNKKHYRSSEKPRDSRFRSYSGRK